MAQFNKVKFLGGTLLNINQQNKINEFYGVINQQWKLLYKATRDGFRAKAFHKLCDNKGATMTIIRSSEGYLFGGYTKGNWKASIFHWRELDQTAFIFTLTNPSGLEATKFPCKDEYDSIYCQYSLGPSFGYHYFFLNLDIEIKDKCNITTNYFKFPSSYDDTTGKGSALFTGKREFIVSDIEVFGQ